MNKLLDKLNDITADVGAELYDKAPIIAISVGAAAVLGASVWACKKTLELPDILKEGKEEIENVKNTIPVCAEGPNKEYKQALAKSYFNTGLKIVKLYRGPVIVGVLGLSSITAGTVEFQSRNAALTATVTSLETMYAKYRKNVIERYGEEVDKELRLGLKRETVKEKVVDEKTGKKKTVEKEVLTMPDGNSFDVSPYARIWEHGAAKYFDDGSREYNMIYLKQCQENANRLLKEKGYLFLNEVYEMLGFPPTEAGQRVGWVYDKKHHVTDENYQNDNYVDFGITNVNCPGNKDFINGFIPYILLDFNVDGDICKDGLFVKNHMYRNW